MCDAMLPFEYGLVAGKWDYMAIVKKIEWVFEQINCMVWFF